MKILFVITRADTVGGVQVHVRDIAKSLTEQGHKALVITGQKGIYNQNLAKHEVDFVACETLVKQISPVKDWQSLQFIGRVIQQYQPNLVCTHSSKAGILGRIASRIARIPCSFTAHGWAFTDGIPQPQRQIYRLIEQFSEPLADGIFCVSEHDRQIGIQAGMKSDRLVTIHNGMPDIAPELRANRQGNAGTVKIAMIARFDKQKDHLTLFKAFQSVEGAELILIGDGPDFAAIQATANQMGIAKRIKFMGFCHNVGEILAQAQMFALISNWEGLPLTIIEAMRAGLPVIASDVGGVNEMVEDGVNGYCVAPKDAEVLSDRLNRLVKDAQLRANMGNAARKTYEMKFTFAQMYRRTYEQYQAIVGS